MYDGPNEWRRVDEMNDRVFSNKGGLDVKEGKDVPLTVSKKKLKFHLI